MQYKTVSGGDRAARGFAFELGLKCGVGWRFHQPPGLLSHYLQLQLTRSTAEEAARKAAQHGPRLGDEVG